MKLCRTIMRKALIYLLLAISVLFITPEVGIKSFCTVTEASTKVKLNKTSIKIKDNSSYALKLKGAKAKIVKWSTSNKKIAMISSNGKVKAKAPGKAVITAKYKNKTYRCKVTVVAYGIYPKSVTLKVGQKTTLKAKGINGGRKWSSSNKSIASVDKKGRLIAKKAGKAKITVKIGKKKFTSTIIVVAVPQKTPSTKKPSNIQPETSKPQPETEKPQPETSKPQPETEKPQPETSKPQPETEKPKNTISLDQKALKLSKGETVTLTAKISSGIDTSKLEWSFNGDGNPFGNYTTNSKELVSIESKGASCELKALGNCEGNLTVSYGKYDTYVSDNCKITIAPKTYILSSSKIVMGKGETRYLYDNDHRFFYFTGVHLTCSDPTLLDIQTPDGDFGLSKITSYQKAGTAIITVKSDYTGETRTCEVTVTDSADEITSSKKYVEFDKLEITMGTFEEATVTLQRMADYSYPTGLSVEMDTQKSLTSPNIFWGILQRDDNSIKITIKTKGYTGDARLIGKLSGAAPGDCEEVYCDIHVVSN